MALPDPGVPLSMSDIQGEFGGSNPISLSEYYGVDPSLPVSGEISISDFYGLTVEELEVKWCSGTDPQNNVLDYLYDGQGNTDELDYKGLAFNVSEDRVVVLGDGLPNGYWSSVCVFDLTGRENPVCVDSVPYPPHVSNGYSAQLIPLAKDKWLITWSLESSFLDYAQYTIATYDGSSITYSPTEQIPTVITGGNQVQRIIPLSTDKLLFLVSNRESEENTGDSDITFTVAGLDSEGKLIDIGTSIELLNLGYCMAEAIDRDSFIVFNAHQSGDLKVRKCVIAPDNSIVAHPQLDTTITVRILKSDILTIKYGNELRAVIDIQYPTDEIFMFNITGDTPVGVDSMSNQAPEGTGGVFRVIDMEWDAYNSSVMAFIDTDEPGEERTVFKIELHCIEVMQNGFGAVTYKGYHHNTDPDRIARFVNGFRNRKVVIPAYKACFYSNNLDTVVGYRTIIFGVPEFFAVPPTITSTPVTDATEGAEYIYDVEATGDAPITFSLDVSPTGMAIDGTTGVVTWTPNGTQVGDNDVDVKASNSGGTDNQPFTITVADAPAGDPEMTTAWVTTASDGLITYDITDPANMVEIERSESTDFDGQTALARIVIDRDSKIGFLGHNSACPCKIYTINAGDPSDHTTWDIGSVDISVEKWCENSIIYDVSNNRFYVGNAKRSTPENLVGIFDATDPTALIHLNDITDREALPVVDPVSGILFVPTTGYGTDLEATDVSDPSNPVVLGTLTEGGSYKSARGAFDNDRNLLFISKPGTAIPVIDISDPANMVLVTTLTGYDVGYDCEYDSDSKMLIVAQGGSGDFSLACFDMTDTSNPIRTGGLESLGVMVCVELDTVRKIAFVTGGANGTLYAVSYPDMTEISSVDIASINPPTDPRGLALTG